MKFWFWAIVLSLFPGLFMILATVIPDVLSDVHFTWEGFFSFLIIAFAFAFIAALVEGASY